MNDGDGIVSLRSFAAGRLRNITEERMATTLEELDKSNGKYLIIIPTEDAKDGVASMRIIGGHNLGYFERLGIIQFLLENGFSQ